MKIIIFLVVGFFTLLFGSIGLQFIFNCIPRKGCDRH